MAEKQCVPLREWGQASFQFATSARVTAVIGELGVDVGYCGNKRIERRQSPVSQGVGPQGGGWGFVMAPTGVILVKRYCGELVNSMQAIVEVSGKRQITIPVDIFRALGLKPGARLAVRVENGKMIISSVGSHTELLAGSLKNVYGRTKEEVDNYIRSQRESWE